MGGDHEPGVVQSQPDRLQSETRSAFVAQTPELLIHDLDGNLVRDGRWMYYWDAENRLTRVITVAGAASSFRRVDWKYDALGRRVRQTSYALSNGMWQVVEDVKLVNDPVLFGRHVAELNGTNHNLLRGYIWGLDLSETLDGAGGVGGLLWVRVAGGPAAGTHFVCYDGNGNVWNMVSASTGSETARYEYGPFGEQLRLSGPAGRFTPFRFSTKRTEEFTGLVLYEYRAYSPTSGRWLSRDPIEERGGWNLLVACANAHSVYVDADGRNPAVAVPAAIVIRLVAGMVMCAAAASWLESEEGKRVIESIVHAANSVSEAVARAFERAKEKCTRCLRRVKGCLPCDPPVGTLMGKVDLTPGHGVDGPHIDLYLVMQSPYPACRCFSPRHFSDPIPGTELPPGIEPFRPVSGGGPAP